MNMDMDMLFAAATAGVVARLVCHPLDTIKTVSFTGFCGDCSTSNPKLSTTSGYNFRGAIQSIWKREGITGFYRGVGVATLGSAPGVALYLLTYRWTNELLQKHFDSISSAVPSWSLHLLCGFFAETVSCAFWVPVDVTKERLQSQPPSQPGRYTGSWNAFWTITRCEGLRGLYRGYGSTLASFGPYSAVYFVFYEYLKDFFSHFVSSDSFTSALYAGGLGNLAASIVTSPLEFIKTRLQVQRVVLCVSGKPTSINGFHYLYKGFFDGLRTVVKEEGPCALWRGVVSRAAFAAPNAALTMAIFNYSLSP